MYIDQRGREMTRMIRKQVYLDQSADKALRTEAKRRGISQAAVIRERIATPPVAPAAMPNPAARKWLLDRLRNVRQAAESGPGTGWRFDRDELYRERLEKADPAGHKRPDQRRGRTRAG